MRLNVLVCAYSCLFENGVRLAGGEAVLGWNIVQQLGRLHQILVLTHSHNRQGIEEELRVIPLPNVKFYYINLPRWLKPLLRFGGGIQIYAYLWQIRAYFAARSLHRKIHFDVFHHVTYANDWMASFIGALLPVPYIRGPGGGAHRIPKGFLSEFSLGGRLWQRLRIIGQWLFRHDSFFIIGQRRARAILVCNKEAIEAMPKKWQQKTHLFPVNGISNEDLILLAPKEVSDGKFHVLSAGKLIEIKGFSLAIKAFKSFSEKVPEADFTIIGSGPELPHLKYLVQELGLGKKIQFEGWLPREELLLRMLSSDLFLFPSLRDGGGAVVVEAMAAFKPVVCLDISGPGFHVDNQCGIKIIPHFPEQAIREMAVALEHLYYNKELRIQLGKAGREKAEKVYLWDRLGERLLKIYQEVL